MKAMNSTKREPGYYWVKKDDAWIVAEWKALRTDRWWEMMGTPIAREDSDFIEIDEERITKHFKKDWAKMSEAIDNAIDNITPDDMEKYFPKDTRPKGWLSIEEYLPMMYVADIMQGYSIYKVKDKDGHESHSGVSDHNTWYYAAKEAGITHWWHE